MACITPLLGGTALASLVCALLPVARHLRQLTASFTALLKAVGEKHIPAIPSNLRILLLGQMVASATEEEEEGEEATETVFQHVIRCDAAREQALKDAACMVPTTCQVAVAMYELTRSADELLVLSAALEASSSADPYSAAKVVRRLKHERRIRELEEAKKIAARRSGARGLKARRELRQLEEELALSELSSVTHYIS